MDQDSQFANASVDGTITESYVIGVAGRVLHVEPIGKSQLKLEIGGSGSGKTSVAE